jgi:hypothetical protein
MVEVKPSRIIGETTMKWLQLACVAISSISSLTLADEFSVPTTITKPVAISGPIEVKVLEQSKTPVQVKQAKADDERAERDLHAQEDMAKWAFWMLVAAAIQTAVGAIGIYYVKHTLDASRAANAATLMSINQDRDIGHAQMRAYLSPEPSPLFTELVSGPDLIFSLKILNSGQTPAYDVSFANILQTAPKVFPGWEQLGLHQVPAEGQRQKTRIAAGQSISSYGAISLTKEQLQVVLDGSFAIYVACWLWYRDVFKNTHEERILWRMTPITERLADGTIVVRFGMSVVPEFSTYS